MRKIAGSNDKKKKLVSISNSMQNTIIKEQNLKRFKMLEFQDNGKIKFCVTSSEKLLNWMDENISHPEDLKGEKKFSNFVVSRNIYAESSVHTIYSGKQTIPEPTFIEIIKAIEEIWQENEDERDNFYYAIGKVFDDKEQAEKYILEQSEYIKSEAIEKIREECEEQFDKLLLPRELYKKRRG